jgi:hypothetical protein
VYRSSFLLDEDLAARQAGLGRLYSDVGFEELALLEGWRSVQADAMDHSGHRLLSDAYSALPRHDTARVSELLQAQLLQPISLTPVPPRLAATDLFILEGTGPDRQAFNEFNPLFGRNRLAVQVSGVSGQNSVLGNEATVSGVLNRLTFSVGQFHYDTDGFRVNNDQDLDIQNAFVQAQLWRSTSVQAEVRSESRRNGDLTLLFNPNDFSSNLRRHDDRVVVRVGARHAFSPRSVLIASAYRGSLEQEFTDSTSSAVATTASRRLLDATSWTGELRHLLRAGSWTLDSGVGYITSESKRNDLTTIRRLVPPLLLFNFPSTAIEKPHHTYAYFYPSFEIGKRLAVTAGASVDFYKERLYERDQFNPKLGLAWTPFSSTTIRLATTRTLHRSLTARQTIEPTHVAGFNQWFEDVSGTDARRHGVALEQGVTRNLFAGMEFSWRNLSIPQFIMSGSSTQVERFTNREQLGRAYASWLLNDRLSVSTKYIFERFDVPTLNADAAHIRQLRTHRVPVDVRYFATQGLVGQLTTTWISQRGLFNAIGGPVPGADRFWVIDASVGYRIPRRVGRFALEIKNLFDKEFSFQDTDPANPVVRPGRLMVFSFTVGI